MIDVSFAVTLTDGTERTVHATHGVWYRWQQQHPDMNPADVFNMDNVVAFYGLVWEAWKTAGMNPAPVAQWVDTVESITAAPKENKSQPTTNVS